MEKYVSQRFRRKISWLANCALFQSFYIIFISFNLKLASTSNVCRSPECNKTAQTILHNMLPTVDPCEDMYEFACGGFQDKASVPENQIDYDYQDELAKIIDEQIESEFNHSSQSTNNSSAFRKAQDFYFSCLDEDTIEKRGLNELKAQLKRIGGCPVADILWDEKNFDLTNTKIQLHREGLDSDMLFGFDVILDTDSKTYTLLVYEGNLGLDTYYLLQEMDDPALKAYLETLVDLSMELGATSRPKAEQAMSDAIKFESYIANILEPENGSDVYNFTLITIEQLQQELPFISWYKLFSESFDSATSISRKEKIKVNMGYLTQLSQLLENIPKSTLANYMIVQSVFAQAPYLTKKIQLIVLKLYEKLYGLTSLPSRRDICLGLLKDRFELVVSAVYVKKYFDQEKKTKVEQLVSQLQAELLNVLKAATWMSKYSLENSKKKMKSLSYVVGARKELYDYNVLDNFYNKLKINSGDFYGNVVATDIFDQNFVYSLLHQVVDNVAWFNHPPSFVLNVVYSSEYHLMDIPAGIITMLYSSQIPDYLNIGLLGSLIASRMIAILDEEAIQYDEDDDQGELWDKDTRSEFYKRDEELEDVYKTFITADYNDTLTIDDIIDRMVSAQGGIRIGYQAFQTVASRKEQLRLIHLEQFSPAQLFWLWLANGFCYKLNNNANKQSIESSDNLISKLRIDGPFQNSPNFALDWNCTKNSPMNPEKKVNVW